MSDPDPPRFSFAVFAVNVGVGAQTNTIRTDLPEVAVEATSYEDAVRQVTRAVGPLPDGVRLAVVKLS